MVPLVIRLEQSPYGNQMPREGAVHTIKAQLVHRSPLESMAPVCHDPWVVQRFPNLPDWGVATPANVAQINLSGSELN